MAIDARKNFAYSTVATAPSPATSGTSLVVAAGAGTKFPAVSFNATIWPTGAQPTDSNAEIVRVTAISTDTFTITRAQESTSARTVVVGDQIAATITKKTIDDIETGLPAAASDTVAGVIEIAIQSEMETGSSTTLVVTPGRQQYHPSAAKFWAQVTGAGSPSLTTNFNVTSIADTGVGRMTITINVDFSSANWACMATTFTSITTGDEGIANIDSKAAGTVEIGNRIVTPAFADMNVGYDVVGFGDQ